MGCCPSIQQPEIPDIEARFPALELDKSDDSSDSDLKARGEIVMKNGSNPIDDLKLSGSSSSVDLEMDRIEKLLQAEEKEENDNDTEFKGTKVDLKDIDPDQSSDS